MLPSAEPLAIRAVHDMVELQPFEGATNRTSTFTIKKGEATQYPVRWIEWRMTGHIQSDMSLEQVEAVTERIEMQATPINPPDTYSSWLTVPVSLSKSLKKIVGPSAYKGRAGVCGWLNGVYWVRKVADAPGGRVLIRNLATGGKKDVDSIEAALESNHLHTLLRGREISRWSVNCNYLIVAPVTPGDESKALSLPNLKAKYPHTYEYLRHFESDLKGRSGYIKYLSSQPFYAQYNIGPYSFAKYKVVWLRISNDITAAVAVDVLPDNGVTFVAFSQKDEAHYLCALMNSTPVRLAIAKFSVAGTGTWGSPQILTRVAIPRFDRNNDSHAELSELSIKCHEAALKDDMTAIAGMESKIDVAAAGLWGISKSELVVIRESINDGLTSKRSKRVSKIAVVDEE